LDVQAAGQVGPAEFTGEVIEDGTCTIILEAIMGPLLVAIKVLPLQV